MRSNTYGEAEDYCVTVIGAIAGCTDSTALNYDPTATVDDGSCIFCVYGCTTAFNYSLWMFMYIWMLQHVTTMLVLM